MRIMIVEDDRLLGDGLASGLRSDGLIVDWFTDGDQADTALSTTPYDGIVLDLGLPGDSGLKWLQRWRSAGRKVPVLVLTARDALDSKIDGLDAGADDYLIKPVAVRELSARLRAITRRASGRADSLWQHGALSHDPAAKQTRWRGEAVMLTSKEMALLEVFLAHPSRVLSKAQIFERLYGWDEALESNALEVFVHHLRKKISPTIVRTVRGVGYALGPPEA